ncbi:uncharacterized protein LOC144821473 isoform X1 [Lissotriton helveticus]
MASCPLTVYRYLPLALLMWFSFGDRLVCNGDVQAASCNTISIYWEIHSEDPSSYLAVDDIIIRELKNSTIGLLQLDRTHTIELMHNNISSLWILNTSYSQYFDDVDGSPSTAIDEVILTFVTYHKNYFANFVKEENFCAGKTVRLLEDQALTLAMVASDLFPVTVNSNFATQLEVLWNPDFLVGDESFVTLVLYEEKGGLLETVSSSGTSYTFSALIPCTEYRICLSTQDTKSQICVAVSTDPLPPANFTILRANSTGVTVYWDKPSLGKYSSFCLEARVIRGISLQRTTKKFTLTRPGKEFTILGLPSCQQVNISAWTVCDSNVKTTSREVFAVTVTGPNEIIGVSHNRTTDGIFFSWTTPHMYHFIHVTVGGKLHGITRNNSYLVTGLPSCTENKYTLQALCGKSSSGIVSIRDYTGPSSISALKIHLYGKGTLPVVTWKSLSGPNATFGYRLRETANDTVEVGEASTTTMLLKNVKNNTEYFLEVFENCLGELGKPSSINFVSYYIETLYHNESLAGESLLIPGLISWVPSNYSGDLHPKIQQSVLDTVKTCVQKLISRCPVLKAASSEISSQSSSTTICLTISFDNGTQTPKVTILVPPENNSERVISTWRGCFNLSEDPYPSSEIICGGQTTTSTNEDGVVTSGHGTPGRKGSNLGTTQKADAEEPVAVTIPPLTANETGKLLTLSTQPREHFWGRTTTSTNEDGVPSGQGTPGSKGSNLGTTQKTDAEGPVAVTIPPFTANGIEKLLTLSTQPKEHFLGRTTISKNQNGVTSGQGTSGSKGSNMGTTRKADAEEPIAVTIPPLTANEAGKLVTLNIQPEEHFWGSEISVFCNLEFMKLNVSKDYLHRLIQQNVNLVLNDGSCSINNTESDYYELVVLFDFPFCGGQMLVNETHIIFQHHLQNTYDPDIVITRGDFSLIWQCVYLRDAILTVYDGAFTPIRSLVTEKAQSGFKALRLSKLLLLYMITLYRDDSFSPQSAVNQSVTFALSETLHIEVKATIIDVNLNKTFHLKVVSCWATMTPDPEKGQKYYFLQNSCPADSSFKWHTPNGATSFSRFSVQMFVFASMKESPIYIHCSSNFCSSENSRDCLTDCHDSEGSRHELLRDSAVNSMISAVSITVRPNSTLIDFDDQLTSWNTSILTTVCAIVGLLTIFFFGLKIITMVLHCQQNRKTYPKGQNSW